MPDPIAAIRATGALSFAIGPSSMWGTVITSSAAAVAKSPDDPLLPTHANDDV